MTETFNKTIHFIPQLWASEIARQMGNTSAVHRVIIWESFLENSMKYKTIPRSGIKGILGYFKRRDMERTIALNASRLVDEIKELRRNQPPIRFKKVGGVEA